MRPGDLPGRHRRPAGGRGRPYNFLSPRNISARRVHWRRRFFVISGFLITNIIVQDIEAGRFSFSFYARRIKSILPALLVMPIVALATGAFLLTPGDYEVTGRSAAPDVERYASPDVMWDWNCRHPEDRLQS